MVNHDLLEQAIAISRRGSQSELESFCAENKDEILQVFSTWGVAPEKYRATPELVQIYGNAVLGVAQVFMENGDPSLLESLRPKESDNPIDKWMHELRLAGDLQSEGEFPSSIPILEQIIAEMEQTLGGTAVNFYLPRAYGLLGTAYFNTGDRGKCIICMESAKQLCEEAGDEEGVRVYTENLRFLQDNQ
ncbi:MAG: hypothetical protein OEZ39_01985 [Gammaproteobacteria bacterium]|nr:hypothetical protein [Gammaproteobacteria bacterium]MDH5650624.1 hypothetical protein [Gammaproteobacteria bacterium]